MSMSYKQRQLLARCKVAFGISLLTFVGSLLFFFMREDGTFLIHSAFDHTFVVGAFITLVGVIGFFFPIPLSAMTRWRKSNRLLDHTTYGPKLMEAREARIAHALYLVWVGLLVFIFAALGQLVVIFWGG